MLQAEMKGIPVLLNKQNGFLSISPTHISWTDSKSASKVEFLLTSIACNKDQCGLIFLALHVNASMPGSTKFLLKISLKSVSITNEPILLSFENESTRNMIKDHISNSMVKNTPSQSPEMQLRAKMLTENAHLSALHRELVPTKLISEDEFWAPLEDQLESTVLPQLPSSCLPSAKKFSITPEMIQRLLTNSPKRTPFIYLFSLVRHIYNRFVVMDKKLDEKSFWTLFFQNDDNIVTTAFHQDLAGHEMNDLSSDLQSLKEAALDFSMESLGLQDVTHGPLISAVNKWSTILLPQTSSPCNSTYATALNEPHQIASLGLKSLTEYISKASGQSTAMHVEMPQPASPFHWKNSHFKPCALSSSSTFLSLKEICEEAPSADFLSSFLMARDDIKSFYDRATYMLKILWHSPPPSAGMLSVLARMLDLLKMMRSSFPPQLEGLGAALESSLTFVISQSEPQPKRMKTGIL